MKKNILLLFLAILLLLPYNASAWKGNYNYEVTSFQVQGRTATISGWAIQNGRNPSGAGKVRTSYQSGDRNGVKGLRYYINGSISRHTHPVYRHNTRCILRILHEAGDERKNTPYSHGICGGCHGCGVDMESHSPRYRAVGGHGQAVVHPRGDRILGGNTVPAHA